MDEMLVESVTVNTADGHILLKNPELLYKVDNLDNSHNAAVDSFFEKDEEDDDPKELSGEKHDDPGQGLVGAAPNSGQTPTAAL